MAEERLEEIRQQRLEKRQALVARGSAPYPAEARRSHTLAEISKSFDQLQREAVVVTVVGRLGSIRRHGAVIFLDLADATGSLQLQLNAADTPDDIFTASSAFDSGDFIEASGKLLLTSRGTQTLQISEAHVISKSIRPLPNSWYGLKDHEERFRHREVDMLMNRDVREMLLRRSEVMTWLRQQLSQSGFIEVETPILQTLAGGAAAMPFSTHHNTLDVPLYLRIAPELFLKRLLVGGLEKVFELGRNFRNEGIDREHNPEFTMLELYWAYIDYEDLMDFTEELLTGLVRAFFSDEEVPRQGKTISFATPWKRERYVELVSNAIGFDILHDKNPESYLEIFAEHGLELPTVRTYAKLVDELYKNLVRPQIIQPTLLYDYPIELAPLAKRNLTDPRIAEKFQLLIDGMEIVKGYTELNDPVEQRLRFQEQHQAREQGDNEAQPLDESYIEALEYGMPPAAGLGLGMDRLITILTDSPTVRDTVAFPLMRPLH